MLNFNLSPEGKVERDVFRHMYCKSETKQQSQTGFVKIMHTDGPLWRNNLKSSPSVSLVRLLVLHKCKKFMLQFLLKPVN